MQLNGNFYPTIVKHRDDSVDLQRCMERTLEKLLAHKTDYQKPGILLGKIQSGKTRAFLGIIALAFDNGYDIAIILTKGVKSLSEQTIQRLKQDFNDFINRDEIQVHDIMKVPGNLTEWELKQKLILVAKKEINNLKRLQSAFDITYPQLKNKRVLIIDDEADFASVSYTKTRDKSEVEPGRIQYTMDELRGKFASINFLQVTATPYSLYLQPEQLPTEENLFYKPKKPEFTVILPDHETYVGAEFYFPEELDGEETVAHFVYNEVSSNERDVLKKRDGRRFKIEDALTSSAIEVLRKALVNFITGSMIRRMQQEAMGEELQKYSFIVHTERKKAAHTWQEEIVNKLKELLEFEARSKSGVLEGLVKTSYEDLEKSIALSGSEIPEFGEVLSGVQQALIEGQLVVNKVNSENDTRQMLDAEGQLALRTPLNVFIGGQILDRGLTIRNLIGFYYGRTAQKAQQDTVLQHSRMYGARPKADLAVTRFYATRQIYNIMRNINEFDNALRVAFEHEAHERGIYFLRKDELNRFRACAPNKLLLSSITTLRPYKRILPIGFQTGYKSNINKQIDEIDKKVQLIEDSYTNNGKGYLVEVEILAKLIEDDIYPTLVFEEPYEEWDVKGAVASLEHVSKVTKNENNRNKTWLVIRRNLNLSRYKSGNRFSDDPDGGTGETARTVARELAIDIPAVILVRQNGSEDKGWRDQPFWWPVIVMPKNTPTSIFASEVLE